MPTLAQHKARVFTQQVDLSGVAMNSFAIPVKMSHQKGDTVRPEHEAIRFYLQNHIVSMISQIREPDEVLPPEEDELVRDYYVAQYQSATRLVHYLFLICSREVRHCHNKNDVLSKLPGTPEAVAAYGKFLSNLPGDSSGAAKYAADYNYPDGYTLGDYAAHTEAAFFKGKYSSSFGGKKWGVIAKVLRQFVHGEISAEMLMDTAFTLQHNTCSIFNKGMLYAHQDEAALLKILDAQRAGMIPEYVKGGNKFTPPDCTAWLAKAEKVVGSFGTTVDWGKVKAAGGVGNHSNDDDPAPATSKVDKWKQKLQTKLAKLKADKEAAEFAKNYVQILPNVTLKKTERSQGDA